MSHDVVGHIDIAPFNRPERSEWSTDYHQWKRVASMMLRVELNRQLWGDSRKRTKMRLSCVFYVQGPKRLPAKSRGELCGKRPDLDRYVHAFQDALQDAGAFADDGQVCTYDETEKRYCFEGQEPCIYWRLNELPDTTGPPSWADPR